MRGVIILWLLSRLFLSLWFLKYDYAMSWYRFIYAHSFGDLFRFFIIVVNKIHIEYTLLFNHFSVYNLVALITFTVLYNHNCYLFPKLFIIPNINSEFT